MADVVARLRERRQLHLQHREQLQRKPGAKTLAHVSSDSALLTKSRASAAPSAATTSGSAASLSAAGAGASASGSTAAPAPQPPGVSAAYLVTFAASKRPEEDAPPERHSTRAVAAALRREAQETGLEGPLVARLAGEKHFVTGGAVSGPAPVHVVHPWDGSFSELAACVLADAAGELDRRYSVDLLSLDLLSPPDDPVAAAQAAIAGAKEVLLVLDGEGKALTSLWVLFESMLAIEAGKLRVRCSAPGGFGDSKAALEVWKTQIDAVDWVLAQAPKKNDEKRLRGFADRVWEFQGKGVERILAQLRKFLRREVYGQLLLGSVLRGDVASVEALLEAGANPEFKDSHGNTLEELAASAGRTDLEEILFERRMRGRPHQPLTSFFQPSELVASSAEVPSDVLMPFLTEPGAGEDGSGIFDDDGHEAFAAAFLNEPLFDDEEEDLAPTPPPYSTPPCSAPLFPRPSSGRSEGSTRTPGSAASSHRAVRAAKLGAFAAGGAGGGASRTR